MKHAQCKLHTFELKDKVEIPSDTQKIKTLVDILVCYKIHLLNELMFNRPETGLSEVFLDKGVLKICWKFTGEHPCRTVISIKLQSNFVEITLWHGGSPVNLLHIFRISVPRNTSRGLLLSDLKSVKI